MRSRAAVKEEYREYVTKAHNTLEKKPEDSDLSGQPEQGVNNGRHKCEIRHVGADKIQRI